MSLFPVWTTVNCRSSDLRKKCAMVSSGPKLNCPNFWFPEKRLRKATSNRDFASTCPHGFVLKAIEGTACTKSRARK